MPQGVRDQGGLLMGGPHIGGMIGKGGPMLGGPVMEGKGLMMGGPKIGANPMMQQQVMQMKDPSSRVGLWIWVHRFCFVSQ